MPSHYLQNLDSDTATDPITSNPILSAAMDAAARHVTRTEIAARKQEDITAESIEASGAVQAGIKEAASDVAFIKGTAQLAEFKAQNARIATYEEAGGIEFQKELMRALGVAGKELMQANKKYVNLKNREVTGVIDYFRKANEVSSAFYAAERVEDHRNDIAESISLINASQESISRALVTTKETLNKATIDAGSRVISTQAEVNAAKARLDSLASNATALRAGMAADATALNAKFDLVRFENTAINQAAREESHKLSVKQAEQQLTAWQEGSKARAIALEASKESLADIKDPHRKQLVAAQRLEGLEDIQAAQRVEAAYSSNVQIGQTVTGLPVEDVDTIIAQGMNAKTAGERLKYETLRNIGLREDATFGNTAGEALVTMLILDASAKAPPVKLLRDIHIAYINDKAAKKEALPKEEGAAKAEFTAFAKVVYKGHAANIKAGDESNPYQAAPMAVLAEYTAVKESALYKNVLEAVAMKEFNAKGVYKATLAGISAGTVSIEEAAAGIETLFKTAANHNNDTKMFQRAGLPIQESYTTEIIDPPFMSAREVGATTGAALATAAVAGTAILAATPPGAVVSTAALIAGTVLGSNVTALGPEPYPLTDSTKREEVMHALVTLIAAESKIGSLF